MKCVLFSPFIKTQRGNSITVSRLEKALITHGIEAKAYGFCEPPTSNFDLLADIVHGFHAFYFGRDILPLLSPDVPVVLTMTGTDYNIDLFDINRRKIVLDAMHRANRVIVFHNQAKSQINQAVPGIGNKISVISPGIDITDKVPNDNMIDEGIEPIVLIVAGLRKVKNVLLAIQAVYEIQKYIPVKLVHIGPALEIDVANDVQNAAANYPWFFTLGEIPHPLMVDIYRRAAVVINTSFSEAIPNSILEAMYFERPVVVSKIAGNMSIVHHNKTGLVYSSKEDLVSNLITLLGDHKLASRLGHAAGIFVRKNFDMAKEVASHIRLYRKLTGCE